MGWERRRNRSFFYVGRRDSEGRFRKIYVGSGLVAELAADALTLRKATKKAASRQEQEERREIGEAKQLLDELCGWCNVLAGTKLLLAGYRQYGRGITWRKRQRALQLPEGVTMDADLPITLAEFKEQVAAANEGDATALDQLRECLDEHPEVWQQAGDLGGQVAAKLIAVAAGDSVLISETLIRKTSELRDELLPASPLEEQIVEQVVCCWLQARVTELAAAERGRDARASTYWINRMAAAQRQYLAAIKTLATVRSLLG